MESIKLPFKKKEVILALGAESAGVFAVYKNGSIFVSENFGDLLDEINFLKYKKAVLNYLKKEKTNIILTDWHPLYKTTIFGEELAGKIKAKHIKIQHHIAHIFSAVGDKIVNTDKTQSILCCHSERCRSGMKNPVTITNNNPHLNSTGSFAFAQDDKLILPNTFFGLAMDGTGYGLDGNIWGGEALQITNYKLQITNKTQKINSKNEITRIGSLEEQIMIGGDLAAREPARMLIAILVKIKNQKSKIKNAIQNSKVNNQKEFIFSFVKKFYARNEFEALYNQMDQNFNCQITTSAGRILDAVAVLLGFAVNERNYKHEAAKKLEENSSEPYSLEPKIISSVIASELPAGDERGNPADDAMNSGLPRRPEYSGRRGNDSGGQRWILQTTPLFEYLIKNIHKDKKRLAATAQLYIAKGLREIIKNHNLKFMIHDSCLFAAGGLSNNKIISDYLEKQGVYLSKKIPRGDEGMAFGQIVYYLLSYDNEIKSAHQDSILTLKSKFQSSNVKSMSNA